MVRGEEHTLLSCWIVRLIARRKINLRDVATTMLVSMFQYVGITVTERMYCYFV